VSEGTCSECGGEVIGPVALESPGAGTGGEVHLKVIPTSGMIRQPTRSQLFADLCTGCGRVELRADPGAIAEAWRQGQR
jgi:hypothetical protein